ASLSSSSPHPPPLHSFPTRRSSDLGSALYVGTPPPIAVTPRGKREHADAADKTQTISRFSRARPRRGVRLHAGTRVVAVLAGRRSEEHTSELQSRVDLVCRLLLEKT